MSCEIKYMEKIMIFQKKTMIKLPENILSQLIAIIVSLTNFVESTSETEGAGDMESIPDLPTATIKTESINEPDKTGSLVNDKGITQLVNILFVALGVSVIILKYTASKLTKGDLNKNESNSNRQQNDISDPDNKKLKGEYRKLRLQYFPAYFAAIFGDWLQGPYVYKLYSEYGFQENHIAILFLTGFGSSFTFGTFTGPLADKFGRKSMTQVFCLLYSLSCIIKFSSNFWILMCGRVCAGIATSLLFR